MFLATLVHCLLIIGRSLPTWETCDVETVAIWLLVKYRRRGIALYPMTGSLRALVAETRLRFYTNHHLLVTEVNYILSLLTLQQNTLLSHSQASSAIIGYARFSADSRNGRRSNISAQTGDI